MPQKCPIEFVTFLMYPTCHNSSFLYLINLLENPLTYHIQIKYQICQLKILMIFPSVSTEWSDITATILRSVEFHVGFASLFNIFIFTFSLM